MPLTIFPLTSPPADLPTFLKHIAPLPTAVSVVDMITPHFSREPRTDEFDGLGRHVTEMSQLEAVVVGIRRVVVRWADGVCCTDVGC
jgi:hypothetical protein